MLGLSNSLSLVHNTVSTRPILLFNLVKGCAKALNREMGLHYLVEECAEASDHVLGSSFVGL